MLEMNKFLKRLNNFEEYILACLLPFMCLVVFVATFCRYTKIMIIPWSEELARYCMVWIIFLGISVAAKKGEHFCVTALIMLAPPAIQKAVGVVRMILMTAFTVFVSRYCITILKNQMMMEQKTPTLKWPMWAMYTAVFIGCGMMTIRYVYHGIRQIRGNAGEQAKE
jgi:C4-dicarboxylate transporter DctQ subunit